MAALDETLRDSLSVHVRKNLAVIPQLLARRFDFLRQDMQGATGTGDQSPEDIFRTWTGSDGWLARFFREMQGLLLAELEFRLLPVMGLVEAVDEQAGEK